MTTRPLNSVKGRAIASLLGGCLLTIALQAAVCAQTASYACEPSLEVKRALQKLPAADDARVSSSQLREQRTTILSPLLAKRPHDLFIHREYQESIRSLSRDNDREMLLQKYHTLLAKHPGDPRFLYLYGRLLIGRRTGEGVEFLRQALQRAPNFPWAHLALVESYQLRTYQDKDQAAAHLKTFMKLCPTSLEAYKYLKQVNDQDLLDTASQQLRMLLQRQADPKALTYYKTLWELEFRVKPPAEHPQLRQQIEEDLQRLRRRNLPGDKDLLLTLGEGYKIISDQDGVRWADEQILRSFPYSLQAMNLLMKRWQDTHPYPGSDSSPKQREAYRQAEWQATDEWSRRWPDHPLIWIRRFILVFNHRDTPSAQTEAAIDGFLNAREKYPEMSNSDDLLNIAWVYWGRGMRQERIPELVQKSFQEAELNYQRIMQNDALPPETKKGFQQTLTVNYWKGWGFLLPTYLKGKQYENARQVLSQIAAYLSKEDPGQSGTDQEKRSYSSHQES
ncbi:MAG: hypothetical protein J2P37_36580, partial [Ktedonobacteraceae bacterium]|nr:hypothetical protein [Ktedonobacteraceae bacterium]